MEVPRQNNKKNEYGKPTDNSSLHSYGKCKKINKYKQENQQKIALLYYNLFHKINMH